MYSAIICQWSCSEQTRLLSRLKSSQPALLCRNRSAGCCTQPQNHRAFPILFSSPSNFCACLPKGSLRAVPLLLQDLQPGAQQENELFSLSFGEIMDLRLQTWASLLEPAGVCSRHTSRTFSSTGKLCSVKKSLSIKHWSWLQKLVRAEQWAASKEQQLRPNYSD